MDEHFTVLDAYNYGIKQLKNPNQEVEIRLIINKVNGYDNMSAFYIHKNDELKDTKLFKKYIRKYRQGIPVSLILGESYFDGLKFVVNRHVLTPRMETEEVIKKAAEVARIYFGNRLPYTIYDVCTGTGCIGISLCQHLPVQTLILSDYYEKVLNVTRENVRLNRKILPRNVLIKKQDSLEKIISFDRDSNILIIANPPYIIDAPVSEETKKYEPNYALYTTSNLDVYRKILFKANSIHNDKALIVFEISDEIKPLIDKLVTDYFSFYKKNYYKDLNEQYRILVLEK